MPQIAPATHEVECWLYYAPVGDEEDDLVDYDGLDPYWALADLLLNHFDGYQEIECEINGEHARIRLNYSQSGFKPRPTDDVGSDRLYEFDVNVELQGERKCHYNISPRYPQMRTTDGETTTTAFDHTEPDEGVSVHCQSSNVDVDEIPSLLARAVFELADSADVGLYHGYFDEPFGGRITALERYVRITRSMNEKFISTSGILEQLSMLLSDAEGTKGAYKFDNEEERGHHHVIRHGSVSAREMVKHHSLGGQIKSYLPEHPEKFDEDDALYHPKVGTKFIAGRNATGAVSWSERHDVVEELDERLLSLLGWAEIPVEPGGTTYVADDHFDAGPREETVPLHEDPTPRLEARDEHILLSALRDMTPSDQEIVQEVATDGGRDAKELADETDTSLSTVYRALQRLDGVIESDNGHVQFVTEKLRSEIRSLVESVEETIDSAAERAGRLVDYDRRQAASSAFDRVLAKYGGEFERPYDGGRPTVRLDTMLSELRSTAQPLVEDVLDELFRAWRKDGRDPATLQDAVIETTIDGQRVSRPAATLR